MRYQLSHIRAVYNARAGMRLLLLMLLAIMQYLFFSQPYNHDIFIGMAHPSDDPTMPALLTNMMPVAFMSLGIALTLEQPADYLASPDYLVYVRRPRTVGHFFAYLLTIIIYSILYCAIQLIVAIAVVPTSIQTLTLGALQSALILTLLLLVIQIGCLAGNRIGGYLAAATLFATPVTIPPVVAWVSQPLHGLPVCALLVTAATGITLLLFSRWEIQ
ncbi:hypothetical protein CQR50_0277 [Bifidobacterium pseudolongum subsp. globosum]|uniref:ABC-2 family transporter protein n=2 Tax=Bifidobacterium pseudolongum TaxID=1694 RepID=A0A2N3R6P0_9BIFI|nr:hypothetical protein CQR50_0277 [Bifidobacterium pseudolongum subsp. globosum]